MNTQSAAAPSHYDAHYFRWQSNLGKLGGWANLTKFSPYIRQHMRVLEFGCGGGHLLANVECREKLGIEINPSAREEAEGNGIRTAASISEVPDGWADLIISNHALEHCLYPLQELQALLPKLSPGGGVVFVVPCELIRNKYVPDDVNRHLYSWSPMCAGNLFRTAGFEVLESKAHLSVWSKRFFPLRFLGGRWLFEVVCKAYGILTYLNLTPAVTLDVRVVATRSTLKCGAGDLGSEQQ